MANIKWEYRTGRNIFSSKAKNSGGIFFLDPATFAVRELDRKALDNTATETEIEIVETLGGKTMNWVRGENIIDLEEKLWLPWCNHEEHPKFFAKGNRGNPYDDKCLLLLILILRVVYIV